MPVLRCEITPADAGQKLHRFARRWLRGVPLSAIFRLLRQGRITVNGGKVPRDTVLRAGDVVEAVLDAPPAGGVEGHGAGGKQPRGRDAGPAWPARARRAPGPGGTAGRGTGAAVPGRGPGAVPPPEVVYEDDEILIVDKPAGVLVHPGEEAARARPGEARPGERGSSRPGPQAGGGAPTLVEQVRTYLARRHPELAAPGAVYRPSPVHRLDRNTSGLVAFGKTRTGADRLAAWFRDGCVTKEYMAVVMGVPPAGELRHLLRRDRSRRLTVAEAVAGEAVKPAARSPVAAPPGTAPGSGGTGGKSAGSLAVLRLTPLAQGGGFTLARVELITGRTHQIRAQLAAAGHPLAGDVKYGGRRLPGLERPALHCYRLAFPGGIEAVAPLPTDLATLCRRLGLDLRGIVTAGGGNAP